MLSIDIGDVAPDEVDAPPERVRRDNTAGWLMATPGLLLLAIWLSFPNVRLGSGRRPNWLGREQYRRILLDPDFRGEFYRGLLNNFVFALVVVPVQTGLALGLALLLNR